MRFELICSGTELLRDKINTNSIHIAESLSGLGHSLNQVTTIGDVAEDFEEALKDSLKRSDVVFTSGGLGPTFDDLTRECVSKVIKRPLFFSNNILRAIQKRFASVQRIMPEENRRQAFLLKGAIPILNKNGTAPGQIIPLGKKTLILLPGPPRELLPMMKLSVLPYLKKKYPSQYSETLVLHVFGHAESEIDELIAPVTQNKWDTKMTEVIFGILAHRSIIDVKVTVTGKHAPAGKKLLWKIRQSLYDLLGNKVYGENEETLESVVGSILKKKNLVLSVAESCTGGILAGKITEVSGSSDYFKEGFVTYSNEAKTKQLGVKKETLNRYGAVSEETAREMALGCLKRSGSDLALSVTGIAGPTGGTKNKPVGTICFGIAHTGGVRSFTKMLFGDRGQIRERAALTALNALRTSLQEFKQ